MTIDWDTVQALPYPKKFPNGAFHWVNDESIERCLNAHQFEDVSHDVNSQPGRHHHAARIATLVTMIESGVQLHRIHLHITKRHINVEDGNHRLRAYQYLKRAGSIRAYVTGYTEVLSLRTDQDAFWARGVKLWDVRKIPEAQV